MAFGVFFWISVYCVSGILFVILAPLLFKERPHGSEWGPAIFCGIIWPIALIAVICMEREEKEKNKTPNIIIAAEVVRSPEFRSRVKDVFGDL